MDNKKKTIQFSMSIEAYERLKTHPTFPRRKKTGENRKPEFFERLILETMESPEFRLQALEEKHRSQTFYMSFKDSQIKILKQKVEALENNVTTLEQDLVASDFMLIEVTEERDRLSLLLEVEQSNLKQKEAEIEHYRQVLDSGKADAEDESASTVH